MSVTSARPVVERIAVAIYERVQTLTAQKAEPMLFKEVIRPKRLETYTPKDRQIVVTQGDSERVPALDKPGDPPAICYARLFNIRVHLMPSESDPTPIDEYANVAHASVVHAVTDVQDRWHTFGGLAFNADWGDPEGLAASGGKDGVTIPLLVFYRTSERSPYEVRA